MVDLSSSLFVSTFTRPGKPPFSYGFPMVFLWFSYGFPMVFQGYPMTSPSYASVLEDVDLLDLEAHVALQHDAMARSDALHNDLHGSLVMSPLNITQPLGISGLLDGYFFR